MMSSTKTKKQENFRSIKPEKSFLRNYISYYYFHENTNQNSEKSFVFYPSHKNALTIYKGSSAVYGNGYSKVFPSANNDFVFMYSGMQPAIRTAHIKAPFNKIGIVFKELGINHFIEAPLAHLCSNDDDMSFNHFGQQLIDCCNNIYATTHIDDKVAFLDDFFETSFSNLKEDTLKNSVDIIINSREKLTVESLCEQLHTNRRKLLRLYKKHLCCSVKDFIDIVRFRKSINYYLLDKHTKNLTNVAINNNYYDQSQFINHFKKLTDTNPSDFFNHINKVGNEDTFWTFK